MLSFFPRGVLDEILNLTESVSGGFPSYSCGYGSELCLKFGQELSPKFGTFQIFLFLMLVKQMSINWSLYELFTLTVAVSR